MNLNFVRTIDYWFGIPLCFVLSIFHNIQKIFIPERFKEIKPKKILFLELSEIGSIILAYSAIKRAKEIYPKAELYFWTFKKNQDSVHILNIIPKENVIVMRSNNFLSLIIDTLKNLLRIRREKIDVIVDMELFSRFSSILSYLSLAKIRIGFHRFSMEGLYRGDLHTHKVLYNPYIHISKNFLALVESLRVDCRDIPFLKMNIADYQTAVPKIKSNKKAEQGIWKKLREFNTQVCKGKKIVVLNPGINENLSLRRWPIENYIELAKKLLTNPEIFVVIIGIGEKVSEEGKLMSKKISTPRFINFIGKTSLKELIDLYNVSTLFISHDSGAAHLASLTKINMIVLFGPETPKLYAPLSDKRTILYTKFACSPCITAYNHRHSLCKDNKCLKTITVEEVYKSIEKYI